MVNSIKIIFLLGLLFATSCGSNSGMEFYITNKDSEAIDSLKVYVTGNTYLINNLAFGETRQITLRVDGESDIKLKTNKSNLLTVEVYFEPRQEGTVEASITKDTVLSFHQSSY